MQIQLSTNSVSKISKEDWIGLVQKSFNFTYSVSKDTLCSKGSVLSNHYNGVLVEIDLRQYPLIDLRVKSLFFSRKVIEEIVTAWKDHIEGLQIYQCIVVEESKPIWSVLRQPNFVGFSEYISRLLLPALIVVFFGFWVYVWLSHDLISKVVQELQDLPSSDIGYLSKEQVPPNVLQFYQQPWDLWKASIMLSLMSGGILFGLQIFSVSWLSSFLFFRRRSILIGCLCAATLSSLQFSTVGHFAVLFSSFIVGYLLFGFSCRFLPYFRKVESW